MFGEAGLSSFGLMVAISCGQVMLSPDAAGEATKPVRCAAAIQITSRDEIWSFEAKPDGIVIHILGAEGKKKTYKLKCQANGGWEKEKTQRIVASVNEFVTRIIESTEPGPNKRNVHVRVGIGLLVESLSVDGTELRYRALLRTGDDERMPILDGGSDGQGITFQCTQVLATRQASKPFSVIAVTPSAGDDMMVTLQDVRRYQPNKADLSGEMSDGIQTRTFICSCGVFWEYRAETQRIKAEADSNRLKFLPAKIKRD